MVTVEQNAPDVDAPEIEIVQGADYYDADGRAITWTAADGDWPDIDGAAATWLLFPPGAADPAATLGATVVDATHVRLELTAEQTAALPYTVSEIRGRYELWAVLATDHKVRLAAGPVYVGT